MGANLQLALTFSVRQGRPKISIPLPLTRARCASSNVYEACQKVAAIEVPGTVSVERTVNWQNANGIRFLLSRRILTKTVPKREKAAETSIPSKESST